MPWYICTICNWNLFCPEKPGSVTGAAVGACSNGTYTYSFAPVPGATSYTWYAPQGCVVTSPASSGNPLTTQASTVEITFPNNFVYGSLFITATADVIQVNIVN
ncbi:MAG: hypothetical protein IPL69_20740 [Saprospiraceae bacterium]|nr:hypothetical protein [Candidatus Brachybacter algidus]